MDLKTKHEALGALEMECTCTSGLEQTSSRHELNLVSQDGGAQPSVPGATADDGSGAEALEVEAVPLSKTQQKKLLKYQFAEELKRRKKQEKKELRHRKTQRKREETLALLSTLTTEEREEIYAKKHLERMVRRSAENESRRQLAEAIQRGQNLVIDLEWESLMLPHEIKSLGQQVMYCYGANARTRNPARLTLAGCRGAILEQLRNISGYANWLLESDERPYMELFKGREEDLVYLTADSPDVVLGLDPSKVYIVGGVVDRNRFKNCTLEKAKEQGIKTGRLPISEHVKLLSSQVLTVNQVMDILLGYLDSRDWGHAMARGIPLRKRQVDDPDCTQMEGHSEGVSVASGGIEDGKETCEGR